MVWKVRNGHRYLADSNGKVGCELSLDIDVAKVRAVLLPNSGWLDIKVGTFEVDAYEFRSNQMVVQPGGQAGAGFSGFRFRDNSNNLVCGPLTTILAVRIT